MGEGTADFGSRLTEVGRVVCEVEDGEEREEEGGAGRGGENGKGRWEGEEEGKSVDDQGKEMERTNRRCPRKPKRP